MLLKRKQFIILLLNKESGDFISSFPTVFPTAEQARLFSESELNSIFKYRIIGF